MKKIFSVLGLVASLMLALTTLRFPVAAQQLERHRTNNAARNGWIEASDFPEKDEFNQSYHLSAGARVEVLGINGAVTVETATGNTAEVNIIRTARNRDDLDYRKITVEQTATSLIIRSERDRERLMGRSPNVRQTARLRLPRQVDLNVSGINGSATVGKIDGPVQLSGINGNVVVEQLRGYSDIRGVNGSVSVAISIG